MRSNADEMASLVYRTAQKRKNKENKKQKPSSLKETVRTKVREGKRKKTEGQPPRITYL